MLNIPQTHSAAHLNVNQRMKPKILEICNCFIFFFTNLVFTLLQDIFQSYIVTFDNLVKWT